MSFPQWADVAADIGLDAIDGSILFFRNHTPVYLKNIGDELRKRGISITMLTTYPDFTHPDPMQRQREMDYCIRDIALASELQARYLRITAGQKRDYLDTQEMARQVADCFSVCEQKAKEYGIGLVYENHGRPGVWQEYDFTYNPKAFLALTHNLRESSVMVNFDTANTVAYGADPVPVFQEVFSRVETIHVADTIAYGTFQHVAIGTGKAPIQEILSIAKRKGFNGWLCIEEGSGNGVEGIRQAVKTVRQMWTQA